MQTFLPYESFTRSAATLDRARLGKQRVEAYQIGRTLRGETRGWRNHPAVRMWRDYEAALTLYLRAVLHEWALRGYANIKLEMPPVPLDVRWPPWLGDPALHASHRSNLLRKNPRHYRQFGWTEPDDLPYVWPV
jgi:hypothetical protein